MSLLTDLCEARRVFRARPAFAVVAVLALTLGIGANATVFTFVDQVLFRSLPYEEAEQLYKLNPVDSQTGKRFGMVPGAVVEAIQRGQRQLVGIATTDGGSDLLPSNASGAEPLVIAEVSRNFLEVLGVPPLVAGRGFTRDPTHESAIELLISHRTWRARFGGRPDIIGQTVRLDTDDALAVPHLVVGVLPQGYHHPVQGHATVDALKAKPVAVARPSRSPWVGEVEPLIRLRRGYTREQGEAEINALAAAAAVDVPSGAGPSIRYALTPIRTALFGDLRPKLAIFPVAAGLVLLIACANVAHLLLARGLERTGELAIRQALGASRWRLASTLAAEGLWLSASGGALAFLVTVNTYDAIASLVPDRAYAFSPSGPDLRLFVFTAALSIAAAVVFGALPAVRNSRPNLAVAPRSARGSSATRAHARSAAMLVTIQIALGLTALAGAGLMVTSYWRLASIPLGFDRDGVLVVLAWPHPARVPDGPLRKQWTEAMLDQLQQVPRVRAVAGASILPVFARRAGEATIEMPATAAGDRPHVFYVTPHYFKVMSLPIVRGRGFTDREARGDQSAMILDEHTVRMLFKESDPLGRTLTHDDDSTLRSVVGVVSDSRRSYLVREPIIYEPFPPDWSGRMDIVIRVSQDEPEVRGAIGAALRQVDPQVRMSIRSLDELLAEMELREPRFETLVLTTCGVVGLLLLAIGVFGVVSHAVTLRVHEVGVRIALGADPRGVRWLVVRSAFAPVLVGLLAGFVGGALVSQLLEAHVADVAPADSRAVPVAAGVVFLAALFASYLPARRASRIDPIRVPRED
ncbi:MAG: ADOP family duplicated permease [Vicinamibacteraceae bacterium]